MCLDGEVEETSPVFFNTTWINRYLPGYTCCDSLPLSEELVSLSSALTLGFTT